jgi:hypothetical protein
MTNKIKTFEGIDYDYRPVSYFSDLDGIEHLLLKNVKGEYHCREIKQIIKHGTDEELSEMIRDAQLSTTTSDMEDQSELMSISGENLPDYYPNEVEISRIIMGRRILTIISIRAQPKSGEILYRVVDEFDTKVAIVLYRTGMR